MFPFNFTGAALKMLQKSKVFLGQCVKRCEMKAFAEVKSVDKVLVI